MSIKPLSFALLAAAFIFQSHIAQAQLTSSEIQAIESGAVEPVPAESLPAQGTYWSLKLRCPAPINWLQGRDVLIYPLGDNSWVIDDRAIDYEAEAQEQALTSSSRMERFDSEDSPQPSFSYPDGSLWLEITGLSTNGPLANVILHGTQPGNVYELMTKTNLTQSAWSIEAALHAATNQDFTPTTIPVLDRTNLFVWARDWTGIDDNSNSVEDWLDWETYGPPMAFDKTVHTMTNTPVTIVLRATDAENLPLTYVILAGPRKGVLSGTPPTLVYTPARGYDGLDVFVFKVTDGAFDSSPATVSISVDTAIAFSIASAPKYASTVPLPLQLAIASGAPRQMALLFDSTNFAGATWQPYTSSNLTVSPGDVEGWHELWIGLRGATDVSPQAWRWTKFKLDRTPPQLVITNPVAGVVTQPMIQLQGFSSEPMASISYDLTNAAGAVTNQPVLVLDQFFDTNVWEFTTNTVQAFDIPLTNGLNTLILHATDLAGNATNRILNFTLDYSSKTNPPAIKLYWPQDGARLSVSNYTCRGWVDDFTATMTANVVDAQGHISPCDAQIERDGKFWIQNLDLSSGTNTLQISVRDAAGNTATTNLTVVASALALSVDFDVPAFSPGLSATALWGSINSTNYSVWINGRLAQLDGYGGWMATNVPVTPGGVYVFQARAVPNTDNAGNGSGPGTLRADCSDLGNPASTQAVDAELQENKPTGVFLASYDYSYSGSPGGTRQLTQAYDSNDSLIYWREDDYWEDLTLRYKDSAQNHESKVLTANHIYNGQGNYVHCDIETSWDWDPHALGNADRGHVTQTCSNGNSGTYTVPGAPPVASTRCDEKFISDSQSDTEVGSGYHNHVETHLEFSRHTQFKLSLFTGGKSVPGVSKLFALGVGAQEEMSKGPTDDQINDPTINWSIYRALRAIAPEDITVGGFGSPGSDHYLFAALAADQTVDITPKAPPDYYEGGVSAAELKLRIFDAVTGAELTDKTTTVFVGEQVSLYCLIVTPASAPPTAYQWTIPGFTISNYVATAYSGTVYSNFPTSLTNVVFYWADGATNRAVTCAATVRGQKAVGQAKFNVQRPDAPWILTPKDHVAVDTDYPGSPGYYYLHAGKGNSTNDAGMLYEYHTTDLKGYNRVFQFQFVQIATIDWKINYDLGTSTNYSMYQQMRGLDNGIRPDGSPNSDYFAARWFFQSGYTIDSPGDKLLDSYVFDWRRDSFECYLLFQPQGGNSCPD